MSHSLFGTEEILPKSNSEIFTLINPKSLDKNKKTLLVVSDCQLLSGSMMYLVGFALPIIEELSKTLNIVYIGSDTEKSIQETRTPNYLRFNTGDFNRWKDTKLKRVSEMEGSVKHNMVHLKKDLLGALQDFSIDYMFYPEGQAFMPPLSGQVSGVRAPLLNEWHDYIGNDTKLIDEINEETLEWGSLFNKRVSLLAYTLFRKSLYTNLAIFLNEHKKLEDVWIVVNDPTITSGALNAHGINNKLLYFENDTRGTRKFLKFPIGELQHVTYEGNKQQDKKDKMFFFMGSIFQKKGSRRTLWPKYLKNFVCDDSSLWIPMKPNGIFKDTRSEKMAVTKNTKGDMFEEFGEMINEVSNHPNYKGHILPENVLSTIKKYKYSLILRCVSYNDSLNYRPVLYTQLGILPFLDPQYDPDCLQIPADIQGHLIVHNDKQINERIEYFENNRKHAEELISKLRKHFELDKFETDEWVDETIKKLL